MTQPVEHVLLRRIDGDHQIGAVLRIRHVKPEVRVGQAYGIGLRIPTKMRGRPAQVQRAAIDAEGDVSRIIRNG